MNPSSDMHARTAPEDASTEEVVAALDANRAALDHTLRELEQRLSPEGLMHTALDYLRDSGGSQYLRGVRDSVVNNPLPVTLTAIGLAWTMFSERRGAAPAVRRADTGPEVEAFTGTEEPTETGAHVGERARSAASGLGSRVRSGAGSVRAGASRLGERASAGVGAARRGLAGARERLGRGRERGREGLSHTRERLSDMGEAAAARYRHSADATVDFAREHPMVLAGAGLALGAVLAALLPPTRVEDERLGRVRDRAVDRVRDAATEQAAHLRERARDVRDAAREEAERQGLTGERAGELLHEAQERVQRVAEAARREAGADHGEASRPEQH